MRRQFKDETYSTTLAIGLWRRVPSIIATVTDLVPGESLDKVWHFMNSQQRNSIKSQLKQIRLFRTHSQLYIGRINHQSTFNFFDRLHFNFMGPFESEEEFDEWCLARVKLPVAHALWKRLLPSMRSGESSRFVLTHGDLSARNIMVKDGRTSGIVDWEYSGFYPEYMEHALATVIHDCIEDCGCRF